MEFEKQNHAYRKIMYLIKLIETVSIKLGTMVHKLLHLVLFNDIIRLINAQTIGELLLVQDNSIADTS